MNQPGFHGKYGRVFFVAKSWGIICHLAPFTGTKKTTIDRGSLTSHVAPLISQFQGAAGADDGVPVMELSATASGDFSDLRGGWDINDLVKV